MMEMIMTMNPVLAIAAGVGACIVVGVGVGIYKVVRKADEEDPNSYKNLIRRQYVCDKLDGQAVMKWFKERAGLAKGNPIFFLAKPTEQTSRMFALDRVPKTLDTAHCLIQCVVDDETNLPVDIRLISFCSLSEKLSATLAEKEYVMIKP